MLPNLTATHAKLFLLNNIINILRDNGFGVSVIDIKGKKDEKKYMLYISITNKNYTELEKIIKSYDEKAFIVVNEIKAIKLKSLDDNPETFKTQLSKALNGQFDKTKIRLLYLFVVKIKLDPNK